MLILSRRRSEKLIIGGEVTVQVLAIRGNQVRLGIEAPLSVTVLREEVYLKAQEKLNCIENKKNH